MNLRMDEEGGWIRQETDNTGVLIIDTIQEEPELTLISHDGIVTGFTMEWERDAQVVHVPDMEGIACSLALAGAHENAGTAGMIRLIDRFGTPFDTWKEGHLRVSCTWQGKGYTEANHNLLVRTDFRQAYGSPVHIVIKAELIPNP